MTCPECGGTGEVTLLTTTSSCPRCAPDSRLWRATDPFRFELDGGIVGSIPVAEDDLFAVRGDVAEVFSDDAERLFAVSGLGFDPNALRDHVLLYALEELEDPLLNPRLPPWSHRRDADDESICFDRRGVWTAVEFDVGLDSVVERGGQIGFRATDGDVVFAFDAELID